MSDAYSFDSGGAPPIDPALAETPAAAPGGMTVGGDPLALGAGPSTAFNPPPPPAGAFGAASAADVAAASDSPYAGPIAGGYDPTSDTYAGITGADTSTGATTPTAPAAPAAAGAPSAAPGTGGKGGPDTPTSTEFPYTRPGAGDGAGAGGGAGAFNANNWLRQMIGAAQGGNPQAQQMMNMLRSMMQQQMMGGGMGMFGQGQQYNPYMNQMFNPWMARMRMEAMRRRFLERQRERQHMGGPPGTAAAMNPRRGGGRR